MMSKTRRWVRRAVLATATVSVVGAGVAVYLLKRPPAVWTEAQNLMQQSTPEQRAKTAEAVVERLSKLIGAAPEGAGNASTVHRSDAAGAALLDPTHVPVDETYSLALNNQELIAMVGEFFDDWTKQRGFEVPGGLSTPVVLIDDGRLAVAFEVTTPSWEQVFSGYVDLQFDADGMAIGRVDGLTAGSLPLSVQTVGEFMRDQLPHSEAALADKIGGWLAELEHFEFRPVLELEHRRRARVVAMRFEPAGVVLDMRVQDHETYKRHNTLMKAGQVAVTDTLPPALLDGSAIVDVPTTTD